MANFEFTPENVKEKLFQYMRELNYFLFNERDLQIYLAMKFKEDAETKGWMVYAEYHLPKGCNTKFDKHYARWVTEKPSIDIVIECGNQFIGIELKYKLRKVTSQVFKRFGSEINNVVLVTDQLAQNNARYDFWKDVKRLELLRSYYDNVIGGVAILITNDSSYLSTSENSDYRMFGLDSKEKSGDLEWYSCESKVEGKGKCCNKNGVQKKYHDPIENTDKYVFSKPNFKLLGAYKGEWFNNQQELFSFENTKFFCYSVIVNTRTDAN